MIAGRYRVEREIGRGGMATVYLCTDTTEGRSVAVKVLRGEMGNAVVVERFLREVEFVSKLEHPQIPKVLDSGVVGDLPFYVMTFIDGESLKDRLDRVKQLPIEEALRITQQVILPTAYAHSHGIVHRDIKPANILLASDSVYVLDFGIARAIVASAESSLTSTGVAVGTPAYMSPEQALADHNIDSRSDIYSLACVTYEMIAGQPPFVGPTAQAVMARRFVAPPPPLRETRESVPESVESAIARAMCKAPADRWQTVEEFGRALVAQPQSPSASALHPVTETSKRRSAYVVAGVAVVSLATIAIVAWSLVDRDKIASGRKAIEAWDFSGAEREFRSAIAADPASTEAQLWMGQLLILKRVPASEWAPLVLRAADSKADLAPDDRLRAEALGAYADLQSAKRCDGLRTLAARRDRGHTDDFSSTVTLADCLVADPTIVPDSSSPSGHRFSSSFNEAASLYEGLIKRNPSRGPVYAALMPRLEMVLWTTKNRLRLGVMRGDPPTNFIAAPALMSDTITFVPYPALGTGAPVSSDEDRLNRLVEQNLQRLRALAAEWTRASAADPDAHETLAGVLETAGKLDGSGASALQSIADARRTAVKDGSTERASAHYRDVRLASSNVRLLLKLHRFRQARLLADTVLSWKFPNAVNDSVQKSTTDLLVGLNVITGRLRGVIEIEGKYAADRRVRLTSGEVKKLDAELGGDALRLEAYAAFGAPRDSILSLFARIGDNLESLVPAAQVSDFRSAVLRRPISLATDVVGTGPLASLSPGANAFSSAVHAIHARDMRLAGKLADSLDSFFSSRAPGEITMDIVLQGAWLRTALGDSAIAATSLDRALRGLSRAPPNLLRGSALAGALVRAMQFRADLAQSAGDEATRSKWAGAAAELWSGGDPDVKLSLARRKQMR